MNYKPIIFANNSEVQINSSSLLLLYLFIPFCIIFALIDTQLLNGLFRKNYFPDTPSEIAIWALLFNFPHIFSSLLTLADSEYINHYKTKLSKSLLIITTLVLSCNLLGPLLLPDIYSTLITTGFLFFFTVYTMYHVLSQQFGLGILLMQVKGGGKYEAWRWLSTISTTILYILAFGRSDIESFAIYGVLLFNMLLIIAIVIAIFALIPAYLLTRKSRKNLGIWYAYANAFMIIACAFFLYSGYNIFTIAIPRFVHDITAFIIYSVHNQNRNTDRTRNFFFSLFRFLPLPLYLLTPVISILLANFIECGLYLLDIKIGFNAAINSECAIKYAYNPELTANIPGSMQTWLLLFFICSIFHYHIESFIWKRGSPHRKYIEFR